LHKGGFVPASAHAMANIAITHEQLRALVVGLPWHRVGDQATIHVM
jgi:hypothetical protein